jgi:rubrerythrin
MSTVTDQQRCIDVCNQLLRGEISAVETYNQALEKFKDGGDSAILSEIRNDHNTSCGLLRDHLRAMGATPSSDSGVWGGFAKAVEGTAKLLGSVPALKVLEEGEQHGIREYRDALEDTGVMEEIKSVIRASLLPPLEKHIATLQRLRDPAA